MNRNVVIMRDRFINHLTTKWKMIGSKFTITNLEILTVFPSVDLADPADPSYIVSFSIK